MLRLKTVLLEALLVTVGGFALAVGANALSPRGLSLSRNYFPVVPSSGGAGETGPGRANAETGGGADASPASRTIQRLRKRDLQVVTGSEAAELFRDPRFQQGLIVFIDARDEDHFAKGHIPGARLFHYYRAEQYLPALLPACLAAQKVVVYCNGGDCEDSEFAALILRDTGVPRENLFVYPGGVSEWSATGMPVETGARGSGEFVRAKQ